MLVKIVENEEYVMTEDFKNWIKRHQNDIFKVKKEIICNDGNPGYILFKVPFRVSKHFTIKVDYPFVLLYGDYGTTVSPHDCGS